MPGLFFELSVLLANPDLACRLALRSQEGLGFGRYLTLFAALFFAFVIGNAFMLLTGLILSAVYRAYRICLLLWEQFESHILLPTLAWLVHTRPPSPPSTASANPSAAPNPIPIRRWTPPHWLFALYARTINNVQNVHSSQPSDAYLWWETLAKRLLLKRYGLSEGNLPAASFQPLQDVLTVPTAEEIRGSLLVSTSHATGWAALIAPRFAPALRTKWYIAFALFLIACGLLHAYKVAKRLGDPRIPNDTAQWNCPTNSRKSARRR
jgi:hypothetical protein